MIGQVTVIQVNNMQGYFSVPERVYLYIGAGGKAENDGNIYALGASSDLDDTFGAGDSVLKTQLEAAIANSENDNWAAYAISLADGDSWVDALDAALEKPNELNIEGVIICDEIASADEVDAAQTAMAAMMTKYSVFLTCHLAAPGIDPETQTWAAYATATKALVNGKAADRVAVVPQLHGNNLGVVAGRLCNPGVTIADTPMRTATGALIGLGAAPVDSADAPLTMAIIKDLADARLSVPQWYNGYDGMYWADHALLDVEGGDFQVYENRRVLDYLARRVRILSIGRIGDRRLNSTASSISANKTYLARPMREASKPVTVAGVEMPGMIKAPGDDAIEITWVSQTEVQIAITAQPYKCPKKITLYLGLDLSA